MEIKEVQNKSEWENFLLGCKDKTFLQSWNWGDFQKIMGFASGGKIWRLGVYNKEELISLCLVSLIEAKRGKYLLIQHGPNIKEQKTESKEQVLKALLNELKRIAREESCSFIRIAPLLPRVEEGKPSSLPFAAARVTEENEKLFRSFGFKNSPMHASAYEATWKLDITAPEEELLKNMRKTTRYLIRQAQKNNDIKIFRCWSVKDIDIFYQIHQEVVKVQKFTPFSLEYLKNEFSVFLSDDQASLFFGEYKGQIVAAAFVIFWSRIGFYHHAALLPKYHKVPIAYLLQWEAIKEAKKRDCFLYDFWGYVDPEKNPGHPWAGPTLFKMGFGGRSCQYLKTLDLPLSKRYWLINLFEKIRRTKRGL